MRNTKIRNIAMAVALVFGSMTMVAQDKMANNIDNSNIAL